MRRPRFIGGNLRFSVFHDESKEKVERERFLALCPGPEGQRSALQQRPAGLPEPSLLVDQAESLLAQYADPIRVAAIAEQGVRDDEWRLQRIRPFDWYTVDYKRQAQRDLQTKYWRMWSIEVRCYRRAGQPEKAAELLAVMEQRAVSLHSGTDPIYWDALATLIRLYEEGKTERSGDSEAEFDAGVPGHASRPAPFRTTRGFTKAG